LFLRLYDGAGNTLRNVNQTGVLTPTFAPGSLSAQTAVTVASVSVRLAAGMVGTCYRVDDAQLSYQPL
jgi:hypothetical protein